MSAVERDGGYRGVLLILSSPSGAGKSTLTTLLRTELNLPLSVSVTTRERRHSEVDGIHYRFVDRSRFAEMQAQGELLEWAEVHGNLYGTPRAPVEKALASGRDMVFDIDWQGTQQIIGKLRADVVSVFILPPSMRELKARLERRAEDGLETIARRLQNAREEITHWAEYDYVLVNEDVQRAYAQLKSVLEAERLRRASTSEPDLFAKEAGRVPAALALAAGLRRESQPDLPRFVEGLLSEPA